MASPIETELLNTILDLPWPIGLALQLYHEFGSKQLIETLHAHGDTGVPRNNLLKHYTQESDIYFRILSSDISFWIFTAEKDFPSISQHINFVKVGGID
jgi:hypothetical protein